MHESSLTSRQSTGAVSPADERYGINLVKTEIREGYNTGDPERVVAAYSESVGDLSDGMPSFSGAQAKRVLRARLEAMFARFEVRLVPNTIDIVLLGTSAVAYGWYELLLTPRSGEPPLRRRTRYLELWRRDQNGAWRIALFIDNQDQPSAFAEETIAALLAGTLAPLAAGALHPLQPAGLHAVELG